MRRLGTESWAGIAMLVIAVAVASPALLGLIDPLIPRVLWIALLVLYIVSVLVSGASSSPPVPHSSLTIAVLTSWALVLTVPGMGLLVVLVVVTAAMSTYVVPLAGSMVIVLLNTGVVLLTTVQAGSPAVEMLMLSGFYLLIQLATVFSTATLLREQRMRTELAQAHVELRAAGILLAETTRTAERLRISRELHDLIGHQLTVLTLNLEAARHVGPEHVREHVDRADEVARALLRDVRSTVGEMRRQPVDLLQQMRSMVEGLPGLEVDIDVDPDLDLGEEQQIAFLRLAQEAVTNTIRHADASRLQIDLSCDHGQATLRARDDGVGARAPRLGNGLRGLRERFEELGGELTVEGDHGFTVTGRVATS
ncbi:sensor histidine kinase [Brachybacterium sp.]|uniref:sensor histidine kinase n=1 Tax=Brachybacterium sp. TaxID=1891286 RepID=UPI002ED1C73C